MTAREKITLRNEEKRLKAEAEQILSCKKLGIHQKTIDKMVYMFSMSKKWYDEMKQRFERQDANAERGTDLTDQSRE